MTVTRLYEKMHLCSLTAEQREKTCSYWYTVTTYGCTPHTAFRTRQALAAWLESRGLSLPRDIPAEGVSDHMPIIGAYGDAMHGDPETFFALKGQTTRVMSNGAYTMGILTKEPEGHVTIHCLNPNANRPVFDHAATRAMEDAGDL